MKLDASGIAALMMASIAIGSIIAPVAQSWITNHYKSENKKLDNERIAKKLEASSKAAQRNHIKAVFEGYTKYTGEVIATRGRSGVNEQGSYFGKILLYLPDEINIKVVRLQSRIYDKPNSENTIDKFSEARSQFGGLTQHLKETLDQLLEEQ